VTLQAYGPQPPMRRGTLKVVKQANEIIQLYAAQGYDLTLRQLYYQFVSRDLLGNTQQNYKRLGDIVSKARRQGMISWTAIVDRTRNLQAVSTWSSPEEIIDAVARQFKYDLWEGQRNYVEAWFEKDALMGVFERPANVLRVPFFSCRGYTSDSEVWGAAQRMARMRRRGKRPVVLHFGDHDPSGLDMTRDIRERLELFGGGRVEVRRLALNMDQVEEYQPPPNPAKETDSRFIGYAAEWGDESWELDALEPTVLGRLLTEEVESLIDGTQWAKDQERERRARAQLTAVSNRWPDVVELVEQDLGESERLEDLEDDDFDGDEDDE
jgi:hypothetical protein